jgi:hypothetical protein
LFGVGGMHAAQRPTGTSVASRLHTPTTYSFADDWENTGVDFFGNTADEHSKGELVRTWNRLYDADRQAEELAQQTRLAESWSLTRTWAHRSQLQEDAWIRDTPLREAARAHGVELQPFSLCHVPMAPQQLADRLGARVHRQDIAEERQLIWARTAQKEVLTAVSRYRNGRVSEGGLLIHHRRQQ